MLKIIIKFLGRLILILALLGMLVLILPRAITAVYSLNRIYQVEEAPSTRLAVVFGAGLRRDGSPTAVLRDRVETAADLYFQGKVEKVLMSGDNSYDTYNEPEAMRQYALSRTCSSTASPASPPPSTCRRSWATTPTTR
jgi:vancomycin permeability regulator SanA